MIRKVIVFAFALFVPVVSHGQVGGGSELTGEGIDNWIKGCEAKPGVVLCSGAYYDLESSAQFGHTVDLGLFADNKIKNDTAPIVFAGAGTLVPDPIVVAGTKYGVAYLTGIDNSPVFPTAVLLDSTYVDPPTIGKGDVIRVDRALGKSVGGGKYFMRFRPYAENYGLADIRVKVFVNDVDIFPPASWLVSGGVSKSTIQEFTISGVVIPPLVDAGGKYYNVKYRIYNGDVPTTLIDEVKVYVN